MKDELGLVLNVIFGVVVRLLITYSLLFKESVKSAVLFVNFVDVFTPFEINLGRQPPVGYEDFLLEQIGKKHPFSN